ncbi:ABC transporter substrate-binding protein [Methanotorris igneus]|uniref:Extracellular ligand-binding receptor n=1 Tax=Methanotorris igneus (strain DSM 5666 / JCM 11834 / Kol 5) TaxID=880724 RepID=F6BC47_METIK|nr:ABC transporter substrate-binding protein [Methanotorris igneus]AEF96128.1 Extracellular ligand-binding receptor [Methanotorris igneus Kol 5]
MWKKLLTLIFAVTIITAFSGCTNKTQETGTEASNIIKIGVLTDLSGDLSSDGKIVRNCIELAKEDVNNYFKEKGLPYQLEIYVEDTKCDPKLALEKLQVLKGKGVNVVIGPLSSSEVRNLASYATSNKIVIISPSSTAYPTFIGFAKPEDKKYIFRFVANDFFQSKAIKDEIKALGFKSVAMIYRGDAWGKGLHDATKENLEKEGIKVVEDIEYPTNPTPADWSPYIDKLEGAIRSAVDKHGKDKVAVVAIGFDELGSLLSQIEDDSILLQVTWVGSDGSAGSDKIIEQAKDKAAKVGLYSTLYHAESEEAEKIKEKYKAKFGGEVEQYGLIAYDATWVAGLAYAEVLKEKGSYDPDLMVEKIKEVLEKYNNGEFGVKPVTGDLKLNEWNDRASGDYAIYKVTEDGWKVVGIWKSSTGQVEWIE